MANEQDERNAKPITNLDNRELNLTNVDIEVMLGRQSGPPKARISGSVPKQWQPPKNESTPSNRSKKA